MITDLWIENFKGIGKRQHIPLKPILPVLISVERRTSQSHLGQECPRYMAANISHFRSET